MIKKKLNKLVGLKKEEFDQFLANGQIHAQNARLIPTLKTGDEMALTSIFLSAIKFVKDYRDSFFKEIRLSRSGRIHYFTEVCIPDLDSSRIDGLIIVVSKGVISDAAFFEMKNKANHLTEEQITKYLGICKSLKVDKLITVSNEFVSDPSESPLNIKVPKAISLLHFSWTYLITRGQLLLFNNDLNIEDDDQVEIMKEVLHYFENPVSGIKGYTQMKSGWKELAENIKTSKPLALSEQYIADAVISWQEEESDLALLLSRKLGVLVKTKSRDIKSDIKKIVKDHFLTSSLSIKDSVSDITVKADFATRVVSMSVTITPPQDKGTVARITWAGKQLENCKKKSEELFSQLSNDICVEADVRYVKTHLQVGLNEFATLQEVAKGKDLHAFNIILIKSYGGNFASTKKFVELIEQMALDYYEGVVQHLSNWVPKGPKLIDE